MPFYGAAWNRATPKIQRKATDRGARELSWWPQCIQSGAVRIWPRSWWTRGACCRKTNLESHFQRFRQANRTATGDGGCRLTRDTHPLNQLVAELVHTVTRDGPQMDNEWVRWHGRTAADPARYISRSVLHRFGQQLGWPRRIPSPSSDRRHLGAGRAYAIARVSRLRDRVQGQQPGRVQHAEQLAGGLAADPPRCLRVPSDLPDSAASQ